MALKGHSKYNVPAVDKALLILEYLATSEKPVTLQVLTNDTRLPKSSAFGILATLEARQFVERDEAGDFRLGPKAFRIGSAYQRTSNLSQVFHQVAREIVAECGETVQLAILDQTEVIYIAREDGSQPVQLVSYVGKRLPAHTTALGKVLLAALSNETIEALYSARALPKLTANTLGSLHQLKQELATVREKGYAHDKEETAVGLQCVAAPIYDHRGQVVAAMSISSLTVRMDPHHFKCVLEFVQKGAREISERMG